MRVKRYVVDSMPDAMQQIRSDLGKDAVILNTKEIRSGGFLGFFSKKKIEVIAATDSTGKAAMPKAKATVSPVPNRAAASPVAVMEQERPSKLQEPAGAPTNPVDWIEILKEVQNASGKAKPQPQTIPEAVPQQQTFVTAKHGAAAYGSSSATKAPPAEAVKVMPIVEEQAPVIPAAAAAEDPVLAELKAMKQMMAKISTSSQLRNPVLEMAAERLEQQELTYELTEKLIASVEASAQESGAELTESFVRSELKKGLSELLGEYVRKPMQPETRIVHFVGPTGVGKTTTIAKLAAEQVLKYRRKVGFITSDTYRIAAVDQLKTYATILGVPLEVVFSPQDLKKAFDALQDRDIIFMDTAGRNFRNEMYVSELNALLQSSWKSETYLVLSLTMKYKDMRSVASNFSKFNLDKVLFTKRDETDTFGPIVNLLHEFPLELSYITTGQNVPDDFTVANTNEIIDLILEEQRDE